MVTFWVVVGMLTAAAAALILIRASGAAKSDAADPAPAVFRRHLAEIDELAERGLMGEAERQSAHAEAGRRLLAATDAPLESWTNSPDVNRTVLAAAVGLPILTLALYLALGSPGYSDQPYLKRLQTWRTSDPQELQAPELAAVMREMTAKRPDDALGFRMLALAEGGSQNPLAAVRAMRRAVALSPKDVEMWRLLGDALVFKAGGKVDAEAQAAFREALKLDPGDLPSRFYLAQAKADEGDTAAAVGEFRAILADLPADDARRPLVQQALSRADGTALPAGHGSAGPAPGLEAIQGMVAGLAARLADNPNDPEGWVRLVRSYAVLGDTAKRDAAMAKAQAMYARDPAILGALSEAVRAEPMR